MPAAPRAAPPPALPPSAPAPPVAAEVKRPLLPLVAVGLGASSGGAGGSAAPAPGRRPSSSSAPESRPWPADSGGVRGWLPGVCAVDCIPLICSSKQNKATLPVCPPARPPARRPACQYTPHLGNVSVSGMHRPQALHVLRRRGRPAVGVALSPQGQDGKHGNSSQQPLERLLCDEFCTGASGSRRAGRVVHQDQPAGRLHRRRSARC